MAAQMMVIDSRLRSLMVLIPALILAVWVASEAASEEFIVPIIATGTFVALVVFSVFVQSVRFETAVLNLLLAGYLVGNRGFADITVAKPLFPGEICLVLVLVAMTARCILTREFPDLSGNLARAIIVFLIAAAIRLAFDFRTYQLDAIRDSAMVYYAVYFFFGRQMSLTAESRRLTEKCLKFSFLALAPIAFIERFAPDLMFNNSFGVLFVQKDDLLTTFAAVAVFILYTQPHLYKRAWLKHFLILFYLVYVLNGLGRASLVALLAGTLLLLIAGRKRFLNYFAVAVVLGLTGLAGLAISFGDRDTNDLDAVKDKMYSIIDFTGTHQYTSDLGALKAGTNDFRRQLWQSFVDETSETAPVFGIGFGHDFLARFHLGGIDPSGLRSAHNYYVTLYGRMGIVGVLIFLVITYQIVASGLRAAVAVRRGEEDIASLGYWAVVWAILVSSILGVVLESPVGAIPFWLFLGIAVRLSQNAAFEHRALLQETADLELEPLEHAPRPAPALTRFRP